MNTDNIYSVPASRFVEMCARVEKINVRARKTNTPEIGVLKIAVDDNGPGKEPTVKAWVGFPEGGIKLAGYKLVGRVDHDGKTAIILADREVDVARFSKCNCDHCKINRARNTTFIVEDEAGNLVQVGSTCLADFLGTDVDAILRAYESLRTVVRFASDAGYSSGDHNYVSLQWYISCCFAAIDAHGFVPASQATDTVPSTATHAHHFATPRHSGFVTDENRADALKAIELVGASSPTNNFESNLKAIADAGVVHYKHSNIAACIALALVRVEERAAREVAKQASSDQTAASTHFLAVGDVFDGHVVVVGVRAIEGQFGTSLLVRMMHGSNLIITFASGKFSPEVGQTIAIRGRVRENGEFNNVKQTVLTRVSQKG